MSDRNKGDGSRPVGGTARATLGWMTLEEETLELLDDDTEKRTCTSGVGRQAGVGQTPAGVSRAPQPSDRSIAALSGSRRPSIRLIGKFSGDW